MVKTFVEKQAGVLYRLHLSDGSLLERDNFQHQYQDQQRRGHFLRHPPQNWQPMKGMNTEEVGQSRWKG